VWWLLCFLILGVGTSPLIAVAHAPIEEIHPTRPKLPVEPNRERLNPAAAHLAGTGKFQTPEDLRAQQALLQRDESAGHIAEGTWRQAQPALLVHDLFTEAGPVTQVETRNKAWSDDQQRSAQQLAHRIALKAMEEVMAERPEGAAAGRQ